MKLFTTTASCFIMVLAMLSMPTGAFADGQWHFQASAVVPEQGLMEAEFPVGLFFSADESIPTSEVDLSLIGPDGNPRSFELYWKEDTSSRSVVLKSTRIRLDKGNVLLWEAAAPKDLRVEMIRIDFAASQTVGKVTIEGKDAQGWHVLAENAALYHAESASAAETAIRPAAYEQFRLRFKGYDRSFKETLLRVGSVTLFGKSTAKDYIEKAVDLRFTDLTKEGTREVSSLLPGSGLWIKSVVLTTEAQFQGTWELGREVVIGGTLQFQTLLSGTITAVGKKASTMEIPINRSWPGRSLVLKLNPGGTYVGNIIALGITVKLPRITFYADKAGTYLAQTGNGNKITIKETPGDAERKITKVIRFSAVIDNKRWMPEQLAEKFSIVGGPFIEKGFHWTASVKIPEAGYYRLVLSRDASLSQHPERVRLVRDNVQVPYFRGPNEGNEIGLKATSDYDRNKNRTTWTITLPATFGNVMEMSLESQGIFDRNVAFEVPKQGRAGWQSWKTLRWQNSTNAPSVLRTGLAGLPQDITELRITMDHGDNRPIDIADIKALYRAPTLLFLVPQPGEYALFGGNPEIPEAKYDLALVQAHLADAVPRSAVMGEVEPFQSSRMQHNLLAVFDDKSWGLYAVLGFVTVILILLIVRLFPKEKNG